MLPRSTETAEELDTKVVDADFGLLHHHLIRRMSVS